MKDYIKLEEVCQRLKDSVHNGQIPFDTAWDLLTTYAVNMQTLALEITGGTVDTNTEYGNIKPEDFSQKESEVL